MSLSLAMNILSITPFSVFCDSEQVFVSENSRSAYHFSGNSLSLYLKKVFLVCKDGKGEDKLRRKMQIC